MTASTRAWLGAAEPFLDVPHVERCGSSVLGMFGGVTESGAHANEDAAFVMSCSEPDRTFAALFDAHGGSDSAELGLKAVKEESRAIRSLLMLPARECLPRLEKLALEIFREGLFAHGRSGLKGEASVCLAASHGNHLWWLNIGDVSLYVFHPEYAKMGQFGVNQRSFFEWVGRVHTFDDDVPSYAAGMKRLRNGQNVVFIATDGLFEQSATGYGYPRVLNRTLWGHAADLSGRVAEIMGRVRELGTRDSATVVAWTATGTGAPESSA